METKNATNEAAVMHGFKRVTFQLNRKRSQLNGRTSKYGMNSFREARKSAEVSGVYCFLSDGRQNRIIALKCGH